MGKRASVSVEARQRQLLQLKQQVAEVQASIAQAQQQLQLLGAIEEMRKLKPEERQQARQLRLELMALKLQLQQCWDTFAKLRWRGPRADCVDKQDQWVGR